MVKKYELPPQKTERDGGDLVSQSLKMVGMGGLIKAGETTGAAGSSEEPETGGGLSKITSNIPSWIGQARSTVGEPSTQRGRKKSIAEEQEEEDDRNIRFTIGGVGQRMTKQDFIKEMQKLDKSTRREVVDHSSASVGVKTLAKQDSQDGDPGPIGRARNLSVPVEGSEVRSSVTESPVPSSVSISPETSPTRLAHEAPSRSSPETAVERRRRLAVLKSVGGAGNDEETNETPAERRRREAALGMSSTTQDEEDSEDDDTPRVPTTRRGIRFADTPQTSRH